MWKVVKRNSAIIDLCGSLGSHNGEVGSRGDLNSRKQILVSHLVSLIFVHIVYIYCAYAYVYLSALVYDCRGHVNL